MLRFWSVLNNLSVLIHVMGYGYFLLLLYSYLSSDFNLVPMYRLFPDSKMYLFLMPILDILTNKCKILINNILFRYPLQRLSNYSNITVMFNEEQVTSSQHYIFMKTTNFCLQFELHKRLLQIINSSLKSSRIY